MAGLLDFLSGDEAALGLGLLAAGGPTTDPNRSGFGQRIAAGVQYAQGNADNRMNRAFKQSQIDENKAQSDMQRQKLALSQRQMDMDAQFLGLAPAGAPAAAAPASPSGAIPEQAAGLPKAVEAFSQGTPATFGGVALTAAQISQKYKIPVEAIINDYRSNGGKKIAEFIMQRGTPDMQVSNGYAYDKNRLEPGFLPSLTTSTSGQTSMTQIRDGQPVVSAPQGALETYGAYRAADAGLKPIKIYNPQTRREEYTSEAAVVGGAAPVSSGRLAPMAGPAGNVQSSGYAGGDRNSANAESIRVIQSEMLKPGNTPEDMAGMRREIARLQQQSGMPASPAAPMASSNFAAGPSAEEAIATKAAETRAVGTASADVVRDTSTQKKEKSAAEMIAAVRRARDLLKEGPTASGAGELMDKSAAFFGGSNKGAEVAAKLDIVAGDLVNNVPRMEGPQSDGDRIEYKIQAGRAADRSIPTKQRIAAMDEVERLQMKYAKNNGGTPGAEGGWDDKGGAKPPKIIDALPTPNASNKGQRIRDTTTGKVLVSNGLQWKEQ